jgi:hypothetical protein
MPTPFMDVNFWTVLIAAITYMVIGGLWYSPFLFGKRWLSEAKARHYQIQNQAKSLAISFLSAVLLGYILGYFIAATHSHTPFYGAYIAFWSWLGFVFTTKILDVLYTGISWTFFAIEAGYLLVAYLVMGAILGSF